MKFFAGIFVLLLNASTSSSLFKVATKQADGPCTTESADSNPFGVKCSMLGAATPLARRSLRNLRRASRRGRKSTQNEGNQNTYSSCRQPIRFCSLTLATRVTKVRLAATNCITAFGNWNSSWSQRAFSQLRQERSVVCNWCHREGCPSELAR
jgi:hypothetical protein